MSDKGGIIRINRRDVWFTADKRPFGNPDISWDTRGLLAYLLTKPDGWQIRFWHLVKQGNAQRYRMRRMLGELEDWGILVRRRVRNSKGQYDWVSDVYENPVPVLRNKEQRAFADGDAKELEAIRRRLAYYGEPPSDDVINNEGGTEWDGTQAEIAQPENDDDFADWFPEENRGDARGAPKTPQEARRRVLDALVAFDNGVSAGIGDPRAPRHEEDVTERIAQHIAGVIPTTLPSDEERWTRGWANPIGEMLACTQGEEDLVDLIDRVWEESVWLQGNATTARYFVNAVLRLARQSAEQQSSSELAIEPDLAVIEENWV